ncbi:P-loop containing nucleoside triphosphate hydrolase protein [Panaeolus papilionaceus]|nr:P-loop containing nucleoside triphosphate hydrolase protein [Panaeolus papilionaceus]
MSLPTLAEIDPPNSTFTTGDSLLDDALGGGIQTGMLWEIVGESSAGKTQLALQLSLFVQLPEELKGLAGSACYLTTSAKLPTRRLQQLYDSRPELQSSATGLQNVHTMSASTPDLLEHILASLLPEFLKQQVQAGNPPVRLLVIDALAELYHSNDKTTTASLVQRSKSITAIASHLHRLAATCQLAVVVLNEVIDVFEKPPSLPSLNGNPLYDQQSRWFNTAHMFGEGRKEASLGLVWANQVNVRTMLTRTGRRKYLEDEEGPSKRRRLVEGAQHAASEGPTDTDSQALPLRLLCVLFSSVSEPVALDYIITKMGFSVLGLSDRNPQEPPAPNTRLPQGGEVHTSEPQQKQSDDLPDQQDLTQEEEDLWANTENYDDLDWDALEYSLTQNRSG